MAIDSSMFNFGPMPSIQNKKSNQSQPQSQSIDQILQLIANPAGSSTYNSQLQGLLAALGPSELQATTNLQDSFRNAGNMASGAYGAANANLQGQQSLNHQTLATGLLQQLVQALMGPATLQNQAGIAQTGANAQTQSAQIGANAQTQAANIAANKGSGRYIQQGSPDPWGFSTMGGNDPWGFSKG